MPVVFIGAEPNPAVNPNDMTGMGMGLWRDRSAGYLDVDYFGIKSGSGVLGGVPDVDLDGDVDGADLAVFLQCAAESGPEIPIPPEMMVMCESLDLGADDDIDQSDYGRFQVCIGGPDVPSPCAP